MTFQQLIIITTSIRIGVDSVTLLLHLSLILTWDRDAPEFKHESDMGGFNIPKIFRQQVNYEVLNIEGIDIYESLKAWAKAKMNNILPQNSF